MSTSPTRYYASRPSSRQNSRPTSPQNAADVRSQAVAKLKRAASLPRRPDGRRPSTGQSTEASPAPSPRVEQTPTQVNGMAAGPSAFPLHLQPMPPAVTYEDQEMLSPSPVKPSFDHSQMYLGSQAMAMQRSISETSSFHMASPHFAPGISPMGTPFFNASPSSAGTPDWAAMQLAQSYLPSLSPVPVSSSPFVAGITAIPGRNTPSPLPTLGDLRNLQRSNSAAARAKALGKLTGGRDTPSDESAGPSTRPGLQRADTLGPPKTVGLGILKARGVAKEEPASPTKALLEPRPRLQRSFTVSSSNMGEERRSAVGRRMVQRLAERKAAREQEEAEVRKLWEERRGVDQQQREVDRQDDHNEDSFEQNEIDENAVDDTPSPIHPSIPRFERTSPGGPSAGAPDSPTPQMNGHHVGALALPEDDRPMSRNTTVSADEPFQYESHLSRSLSSRTARGAPGVTSEVPVLESIPSQEHLAQTPSMEPAREEYGDDLDDLQPPRPAFATPTRHTPNPSASSDGTMRSFQSPGTDSIISRDGLGSMMFIMGGSGTHASGTGPQREGSFPIGVQENGTSDWGTPGKDEDSSTLVSAYQESPTPSAPHERPSSDPQTSGDGDLTPSATSRRTSGMSWEEVGGDVDREVPTDARFHKKAGSISAKIGRTVKTAMRKRSQSRSSVSSSITSPPRSPNPQDSLSIIGGYGRRGSSSSTSPAATKTRGSPLLPPGDFVRHQPSISSLSPSFQHPESSANSILLQHQLASEPSSNGFLPRADLNDPRIHSSKLSPFPGMSSLEGGHRLDLGGGPPKLVHQASDSVVPTQQRSTPPTTDNIYTLPLPSAPVEDRRVSDDSLSKRSWLAKAFGQSPRSSVSNSRKNSSVDLTFIPPRKPSADLHPTFAPTVEADPFAGPPPPAMKQRLHRAGSPSVSVVPEASKEGSRMTRFTTNWREHQPSPLHSESGEDRDLPPRSKEVLKRMDEVLALEPDDPGRPDILDDPPRKLVLATQVLQVVNTNTAKDRFLFLFNDILVITKPLISSGINATLDMKFLVKSVVSLDRLHAIGLEDQPLPSPERDALVASFVHEFARSPRDACKRLVQMNGWSDHIHLATILWRTPELDKSQLGALLCADPPLLSAFIDLFHFRNVPLVDALRMFLLSVRLPGDPSQSEVLLRCFAARYHDINKTVIPFSRDLTAELVLAILHLNDSMYGNRFGFAMHNPAIRPDIFAASFRSRDPTGQVDEHMLLELYASLKRNQLATASAPSEAHRIREMYMRPTKIPAKLTYGVWSEPITIFIPAPDQNFGVQLLGEGLEFDPPLLEFLAHPAAAFRVRGTSLGLKAMLFDRIGENAPLYANLPNGHVFNVERAFMRHTFQVSFSNHLNVKRKYCFSLTDATLRQKWATLLPRQIALTRQHYLFLATSPTHKIRQAAENVALHVLRDALIPSPPPAIHAASPEVNDASEHPSPRVDRIGSVSIAYGKIASGEEALLGPLLPTKPSTGVERNGGMVDIQTGKELVLVCRQNSLLPGMLELLQAGVEPRSASRAGNMV